MRKFIPWIVLLLAVAAAIAFREPLATWAGARWAGISGQAAEAVASGPLVASGAIEARDLAAAAAAGGRVVAVHAREGDQVVAGEVIATLDTTLLDAQIAEARARAAVADAQVALLRAGPREADLAVAMAAVEQAAAAAAAARVAADDAGALVSAPGALDVSIARAGAAVEVATEEVAAAAAAATAADLEQQLWGRIVQRLEQGADVSLPPELGGGSRHVDAPAEQLAEARLTWNLRSQAAWRAHADHVAAAAARDAARRSLADLRGQKDEPIALQGQADAAAAAIPVADATVAAARADLALLEAGAAPAQIAVAESLARQAHAAAGSIEATRADYAVRAPEAGTITALVLHAGEVAAPGAAIARLADLAEVTLTVYVPQARMAEVRVGGAVAARVDAYADRTFSGTVRFVADRAEFTPKSVQTQEERAATVYAVEIALPNEDRALKPGMPADAVFCAAAEGGAAGCAFPEAAADAPRTGLSALLRRAEPAATPTPQAAPAYAGAIEATTVRIAAEVGGRAVEAPVSQGDKVAAGQVLLLLDDTELQAKRLEAGAAIAAARAELDRVQAAPQPERVAQVEAALQQAEAALNAAQARLDAARRSLEKPQELDAQINDARQQVSVASAAVDSARAGVRTAQVLQESLPNPGSDEDRTRRAMYDQQAAAAGAALRAATARVRGAEAVLARLLAIRGQPVALEAAVHAAENDVRMAEAARAVARAGLAQVTATAHPASAALARAQVAHAEAGLAVIDAAADKLQVRSPIAGEVVLQAIHAGEVAAPGSPLFTVADLSSVKLTAYVPVAEVGQVQIGQAAQVTVDAYPGRTFAGAVTHIADRTEFTPKNVQTADERARMVVAVEVTLPNADGALRPGMAAEATW